MKRKKYKPKIMVSSSVYGFENELNQICALLKKMGYEVWNSHLGTIKVNPELSNMDNCLKAVEEIERRGGHVTATCSYALLWLAHNRGCDISDTPISCPIN